MNRLIIIRGNSGSGKSTVAKRLQQELGYGTMLIQQDVFRREIIRIKGDPTGNPTVQLIKDTALYGKTIGYDVIIEGILQSSTNGDMLRALTKQFDKALAYYLEVPFAETLRRHATKPEATKYGEKEMRTWWLNHDVLGIKDETTINETMTEPEIVAKILADLQGH